MSAIDLDAIAEARQRLRDKYLSDAAERPNSTARGIHHMAVLSSNVERTIQFYQGILEFPLTDIFENRDYRGSNHFFFDIGNGNALAFFDFPGLDLGDYREVLGGLHHVALSMEPAQWERIKTKLDREGIDYQHIGRSIYFRDPDGTRLELIPEPLGEMNGSRVV
ncbi:MAG: glyoxalase [Candidatus Entotheonella factor]|uniref:Glyoxalase n=1 Tax=Entotheonella factor TaxID=1429438 RepID=W4LCK7_ENTF1|nr:VOC family protein [Candidatus Entotheonella palauensis]ETW95669.1 MAG: glyoxalase [Candidatus Entotheonella factor]